MIFLFCDGCGRQNKILIFPTILLNLVNNLKDVSLRFFDISHGQNEGDSVHSTISAAYKGAGEVFTPSELVPFFRLARRQRPYTVHSLQFDNFLDFKGLSEDIRINSIVGNKRISSMAKG